MCPCTLLAKNKFSVEAFAKNKLLGSILAIPSFRGSNRNGAGGGYPPVDRRAGRPERGNVLGPGPRGSHARSGGRMEGSAEARAEARAEATRGQGSRDGHGGEIQGVFGAFRAEAARKPPRKARGSFDPANPRRPRARGRRVSGASCWECGAGRGSAALRRTGPRGAAWHRAARLGTALHSTPRHATARHSSVRHRAGQHGLARNGTALQGTAFTA